MPPTILPCSEKGATFWEGGGRGVQKAFFGIQRSAKVVFFFLDTKKLLGYSKLFWDTTNFLWDTKNFLWVKKNFLWDKKNFLWDAEVFFFGIQKTFLGDTKNFFLGYRGFFRDAKVFFGIQKENVDTNPKTSRKLQHCKNYF